MYAKVDGEMYTFDTEDASGLISLGDASTRLVSVSASYLLSPGVKLFGGVQHYDMEAEATTAGGGTINSDARNGEATMALIGTKLSF